MLSSVGVLIVSIGVVGMPKLERKSLITTRLSSDDMKRFREAAQARGLPYTELARDAIRFYLHQLEDEENAKREGVYAQQMRASTNRVCALLAKATVGVETIMEFLGRLEDSEDLVRECKSKAAKRVVAGLTPEEDQAARAMASKLMGTKFELPKLNFASQESYAVKLELKGYQWSELMDAWASWLGWCEQAAASAERSGQQPQSDGLRKTISFLHDLMNQIRYQVNELWSSQKSNV
jgi:hypothetical protein